METRIDLSDQYAEVHLETDGTGTTELHIESENGDVIILTLNGRLLDEIYCAIGAR